MRLSPLAAAMARRARSATSESRLEVCLRSMSSTSSLTNRRLLRVRVAFQLPTRDSGRFRPIRRRGCLRVEIAGSYLVWLQAPSPWRMSSRDLTPPRRRRVTPIAYHRSGLSKISRERRFLGNKVGQYCSAPRDGRVRKPAEVRQRSSRILRHVDAVEIEIAQIVETINVSSRGRLLPVASRHGRVRFDSLPAQYIRPSEFIENVWPIRAAVSKNFRAFSKSLAPPGPRSMRLGPELWIAYTSPTAAARSRRSSPAAGSVGGT